MIVDTSALVAIMLREPGHERLVDRLAAAEVAGIGAPTVSETGLVLTAKLRRSSRPLVARFLQEARLVVVPFGEEHWRTAIEAYGRFGRGRHGAGLNFGHCLTYAVARLAGRPLLCVGSDVEKTDLTLA